MLLSQPNLFLLLTVMDDVMAVLLQLSRYHVQHMLWSDLNKSFSTQTRVWSLHMFCGSAAPPSGCNTILQLGKLQQLKYDIKITPPPAGYHLHFYVENHSYLRLTFFSRSSSPRSVDFSVFSFCNFLLMRSLIFSLLSESYSSSASPSSMSPSDSSPPWREHVQIYDHYQRRSTDKGSKCLDFALHTSAVSPDFFPFFLLMQNYVFFC